MFFSWDLNMNSMYDKLKLKTFVFRENSMEKPKGFSPHLWMVSVVNPLNID
jgi:hypothetical protein